MTKSNNDTRQEFSKQQLINCERYAEYRDILTALLPNTATHEEAARVIKNFLRKKVK